MLLKTVFLLTLFGITKCEQFDEGVDKPREPLCLSYIVSLFSAKDWALKMFDASSKIPSGLLEGNAIDLGNYDECLAIEYEYKNASLIGKYCGLGVIITIPKDKLPIDILRAKGIDTFINLESINVNDLPELPLMFSLCLPEYCKPSDFKLITKIILAITKPFVQGIDIKLNDYMCETKNSKPEFDKYVVLGIVMFALMIFIAVTSTCYDYAMDLLGKTESKNPYLASFSFYTNGKNLITITRNPNHIKCMDGLRSFSIMWVIAGQRYWIAGLVPNLSYLTNLKWKTESFSQYIQSSPLAVDTFLCLSGVLLAYDFTKKKRANNFKFNIFRYYLHRYLRLTPANGAVFILAISWIKYLASGPIWATAMKFIKNQCINNWWSYFLYVQNYVNPNDVCLMPSWYLSIEMQLAIISPLILIQMIYYPKQFKYIILLLTATFILVPFLVVYNNNIKIQSPDYYTYYYYATHTRIAPWFIGIFLGSLVAKARKLKIHWALNLGIWIVVLLGMGAVVFTGSDVINNFSNLKTALYLALHRSAWSVGVCWIIYACVTGNGGIINWFLSLPVFHIISKISYSMYVLQFGLIMLQVGRMRQTTYVAEYELFYLFSADFTVIGLLAIVWTLLFVTPFGILEKLAYKRRSD